MSTAPFLYRLLLGALCFVPILAASYAFSIAISKVPRLYFIVFICSMYIVLESRWVVMKLGLLPCWEDVAWIVLELSYFVSIIGLIRHGKC
jgi:hypothetical protein